ncbi:DUF1987 domain-containing protein [Ohtaekwangia koreensis]|uniref:SiaC family regulatory phosphoprotein domain-containing protein n=1 Tax=Ohtaekwangia koreensis TaxID=688867 RepID=A0A1T5MMP6_9BACT|nr:DUF1987 domain-containing protein [Ohtaekwangia koreensis]SKC89517.1 protein of unknown function [Ohtaekwangia koreensis]
MEDLTIAGSRDIYFSPSVNLKAATGVCSISGESYLEEPYEFYKKIATWFTDYIKQGGKSIVLDLKLSYFNTSSSRAILETLRVLKDIHHSGNEVIINWYYPNPDDDEILMEGEDFQEECGIPINMIEYELQDSES